MRFVVVRIARVVGGRAGMFAGTWRVRRGLLLIGGSVGLVAVVVGRKGNRTPIMARRRGRGDMVQVLCLNGVLLSLTSDSHEAAKRIEPVCDL